MPVSKIFFGMRVFRAVARRLGRVELPKARLPQAFGGVSRVERKRRKVVEGLGGLGFHPSPSVKIKRR